MSSIPSASGPSPSRPPLVDKAALLKEPAIRTAEAISRFAKPKIGPSGLGDYQASALSLVCDQASQITQIDQSLVGITQNDIVPVGLGSANAVTKSVTRLVDLGVALGNLPQDLQVRTTPDQIVTWDQRVAQGFTLNQLAQSVSYYAVQVCSLLSNIRSVVSQIAPSTKDALDVLKPVGNCVSYFLIAFSSFRIFSSSRAIHNARIYRNELRNVALVSDKLAKLKELMTVSDDEVKADLSAKSKDPKKFLKDYFDAKAKPHVEKLLSSAGKIPSYDLTEFAEKLTEPVYKAYLCEHFHVSQEIAQNLSAEEFLALVFYKQELGIEKQNHFINSIADSPKHGEQLRKMITTAIKTKNLAQSRLSTGTACDDSLVRLINTIDASATRKIMKESFVVVSCVAMIVACGLSIAAGPAAPAAMLGAIAAFWILSNAIEYGLSLRDFAVVAKQNEDILESQDLKGWLKNNWKVVLSIAAQVLLVALTIAFLASPLGAGISAFVIAAIVITVAVSLLFNIAVINKDLRKALVKHADWVDRVINQKFAYIFGETIEVDQEYHAQLEDLIDRRRHVKFCDKVLKMSLQDQNNIVKPDLTKLVHNKRKVSDAEKDAFLKTPDGQKELRRLIHIKLDEMIGDETLYKQIKQTYDSVKLRNRMASMPAITLRASP